VQIGGITVRQTFRRAPEHCQWIFEGSEFRPGRALPKFFILIRRQGHEKHLSGPEPALLPLTSQAMVPVIAGMLKLAPHTSGKRLGAHGFPRPDSIRPPAFYSLVRRQPP
jgi:hypothetical protein